MRRAERARGISLSRWTRSFLWASSLRLESRYPMRSRRFCSTAIWCCVKGRGRRDDDGWGPAGSFTNRLTTGLEPDGAGDEASGVCSPFVLRIRRCWPTERLGETSRLGRFDRDCANCPGVRSSSSSCLADGCNGVETPERPTPEAWSSS